MVKLYSHQLDAVDELQNGNVLWGGVGSGKSLTSLAYYIKRESPKPIYVITTAKKRDGLDWEKEAAKYGIGKEEGATLHGVLTVDSWNNIKKYQECKDAFFIFDEQRLVGYGAWVKSFLKIAKANRWILLSATPGDTWMDYVPVFIANGFYKNKTEFMYEHVIMAPYSKYPKIARYVNTGRLIKLRRKILVEMPYKSHVEYVFEYIKLPFDEEKYKTVWKKRWNPWAERPIKNISELFFLLRKVSNSDESRFFKVRELMKKHPRLIIFYTFDYELEMLRELAEEGDLLCQSAQPQDLSFAVAEWNGHKHEPIPDTDRWVYLVQYASGSEGWNCTSTNAMIFWSLTHSYKMFKQAQGRIDRLDTPFKTLYYYVFLSNSRVDISILQALKEKRNFNESDLILTSDD